MGPAAGIPPARLESELRTQVSRGLQVLDSQPLQRRAHFRRVLRGALRSQHIASLPHGASLAAWLVSASPEQLAVFTLVVLAKLQGKHTYGGATMCRIVGWATKHLNMRALLTTLPGVSITRLRWSARQHTRK